MKIKIIKLTTAFVSLLIGFAIVHTLSPKEKLPPVENNDHAIFFEFKDGAEAEISCVYGRKPHEIHFTAYQRPKVKLQGVDYQQAFCEKLPGTGRTIITLDLMGEETRSKSMTLKLVRHETLNISTEARTASVMIHESFYNGASRGIIQSTFDFELPGFYTLIVEVGGGVITDNEIVRIPFEVAEDN